MKLNKLPKSDQIVYEETFKSGFKTFISPMSNTKKFKLSIVVNIGGILKKFEIEEKNYEVPTGIAHFLEHQMFEGKDEIIKKFDQNGLNYNAFTSQDMTSYYLTGVKNIEESLKALLDLVFNINISKTTVEKERDIIEQERRMYDDMITMRMIELSLKNLFTKSEYRNPTIGYKKDIERITKEDLELCYNNFYIPNNMFLVATGNVDVNHINKIVLSYLKDYTKKRVPTIKTSKESEKVLKKKDYIIEKTDIERYEKLYKIKINKKINIWKQKNYFEFLIMSKWGKISYLNEKLKDEKIITNDLGWNVYFTDSFFILSLMAETKNHEKCSEIFKDVIDNEISKSDFEIVKNNEIGNYIKGIDEYKHLNDELVESVFFFNNLKNSNLFNVYNTKIEEMNEYIKTIDFSNSIEIYLKNKKKQKL